MSNTDIKLAEELRGLGLLALSKLALEGHYGDFSSPLATPKMALVDALWTHAEEVRDLDRQQAILALRKRVINGEFDG